MLTRHLATEARAANAFEQHDLRGGTHTIGFCASQRHADFMAQYFNARGKRACAVHSGAQSAPRTNSLEALRKGELDVVFSVDMFNEGVDLPTIDTVLMLRPTESRVLWLQQLGRGLRTAAGKDHLRVIDYIGNHRTFLDKPRALLTALLGIGDSHEELRMALQSVREGRADLPEGCSVTYDLEAQQILDRLLQPTSRQERLRAVYHELRERYGRRPSASELYRSGALSSAVPRQTAGGWHDFVRSMGDLSQTEADVVASHGPFLREIEKSRLERSYKLLLLQAMLELEVLPGSERVDVLANRLERIASRSPSLRHELQASLVGDASLATLVRQNPMRAWAGTKRGQGSEFFELNDSRFGTKFEVAAEQVAAFAEMTRELIEWRLADYLDRARGSAFECRVARNTTSPILMLPNRATTPGLPEGEQEVLVDGERYSARFAKIAINVLRPLADAGASNALPDLLCRWFGDDAGMPGNGDIVRCELVKDQYVLSPVAEKSGLLAVWNEQGEELDAHFQIEVIGRRTALVYMSRGGKKGTPAARNTDYTSGLDALLARAGASRIVLVDAMVDSLQARSEPVGMRRLRLPDQQLPLDLEVVPPEQVRRWLAKAQRALGGNETRQLRLMLQGAGGGSAEELARQLAGGR